MDLNQSLIKQVIIAVAIGIFLAAFVQPQVTMPLQDYVLVIVGIQIFAVLAATLMSHGKISWLLTHALYLSLFTAFFITYFLNPKGGISFEIIFLVVFMVQFMGILVSNIATRFGPLKKH